MDESTVLVPAVFLEVAHSLSLLLSMLTRLSRLSWLLLLELARLSWLLPPGLSRLLLLELSRLLLPGLLNNNTWVIVMTITPGKEATLVTHGALGSRLGGAPKLRLHWLHRSMGKPTFHSIESVIGTLLYLTQSKLFLLLSLLTPSFF